MSKQVLRVVLLGKTGTGKSSLGNTLLGNEVFRVARGLSSGTDKCQWGDSDKGHVILQVTDTPGLCDTHRPQEDVLNEIGKSVAVASPGPHVILMVLRCDMRFTLEEYNAYNTLKSLFGNDIRNFMIVVFSGADSLGSTPNEQQKGVQAQIAKQPPQLNEVIDDSGGRYFAVNNKDSPSAREIQANTLINMMIDLVNGNGGVYFSNRLCEDVSRYVEILIQNKMQSRKTSHQQAERETKQAIVEEKAGSEVYAKLVSILKDVLVPAFKVAASVATVASVVAPAIPVLTSLCSLM